MTEHTKLIVTSGGGSKTKKQAIRAAGRIEESPEGTRKLHRGRAVPRRRVHRCRQRAPRTPRIGSCLGSLAPTPERETNP